MSTQATSELHEIIFWAYLEFPAVILVFYLLGHLTVPVSLLRNHIIHFYFILNMCTKAPAVNNIYCIFSLKKATLASETCHVSFCHIHVSFCRKTSLSTSCSGCSPHVTQRWCLLISVKREKSASTSDSTYVVQNYILRRPACSFVFDRSNSNSRTRSNFSTV